MYVDKVHYHRLEFSELLTKGETGLVMNLMIHLQLLLWYMIFNSRLVGLPTVYPYRTAGYIQCMYVQYVEYQAAVIS
jgi:hypothetical protein